MQCMFIINTIISIGLNANMLGFIVSILAINRPTRDSSLKNVVLNKFLSSVENKLEYSKYVFFCVQQKSQSSLEQVQCEWWQNFHFWVNYPFYPFYNNDTEEQYCWSGIHNVFLHLMNDRNIEKILGPPEFKEVKYFL